VTRNIVFALVPSVIVLIAGLLAGEIYLRMRHADLQRNIEAKAAGRERCTQASSDPRRIYEGVPNRCGNNALGFRDVAHAFDKPRGTYRVVVIGDSVAMGQGVRTDEAMGKVIERILNRDGRTVETILLAVTGYSTVQELALLDFAYRYQPDVIVWAYVLNDPADPVLDNANGELGAYFHAPASYALDYVHALWRRAVLNFKARDCPSEFHFRLHCMYRDAIERNFEALARSADAHKVPIVVVIVPLFPDGAFRDYAYASIHDDVRTMASARGLRVIDARTAFAGLDAKDLRLPGDPWHPNARGHEILGRYVADGLGNGMQ